MQSKAATVAQYLAELPADRRAALEAVRKVILKNLDTKGGYEEGMQYGMIGYYVPHRVFPAGYHCDPKQPLPFAGLASQKNYMSLYLAGVYCGCDGGADTSDVTWFRNAWAKTGKKLDMGKACIRFKKVDDLALDVVGESIRRIPVKKYLAHYEASILSMSKAKAARASQRPTARKPAPKRTAGSRSASATRRTQRASRS